MPSATSATGALTHGYRVHIGGHIVFRFCVAPRSDGNPLEGLPLQPLGEAALAVGAHIPVLPYFEGPEGPEREARFWEKVAKRGPDDCWYWQASSAGSGYGRFKVASYTILHANRVAWALANRAEPGDLVVRHKCDNPLCCNPAHLLIGTVADNNNDKLERGRFRPGDQRGSKNPMARLSESDVVAIVGLIRRGHNNTQISAQFPVGHSLVSRIRTGRSWQREAAKAGWPPALDWLDRNGGAAGRQEDAA